MSQQRLIGSPENTKQRIARRGFRSDSARSFHGEIHFPIRQLQRMLGNQRVAHLIQTKRLTTEGKIIGLQRKLIIGGADELTHVVAQARAWQFGASQSTNERRLASSTPPITGVIARQPDPSPPPGPGWSDAPEKGLKGFNKGVTTVDEKGKILPGKVESATSEGVWCAPVEGLQKSKKGRAVALIPNTVHPTVPDKKNNVPVDVLLHLHGYGVGYRELKPAKHDYAGVLEAGQLRD